MLKVIAWNQFEKDLKLAKRRGKSMKKIKFILKTLEKGEHLPQKHRPHNLSGQWTSYSECHIEPDWLLIYRIEEDTLELARTGTHSDLF